jgi:hypothetical protein
MENKKFEYKVHIHLIGNAWERIQIYKYVRFTDAHLAWLISYNEHKSDYLKGKICFYECQVFITDSDNEICRFNKITKK